MAPRGQRRLESDADELLESTQDRRARLRELGTRPAHDDRIGVEPQHVVRPVELDVDRDLARRLGLARDDGQRQRIPCRSRTRGQPESGRFGGERRHDGGGGSEQDDAGEELVQSSHRTDPGDEAR